MLLQSFLRIKKINQPNTPSHRLPHQLKAVSPLKDIPLWSLEDTNNTSALNMGDSGVVLQYIQDRWRVGLTVRDEVFSGYRILVTNDLQDSLGVAIPDLTIKGVPQYDPRSAELEFAYTGAARWTHILHLAYQQWSAFPAPTTNPVDGGIPLAGPGFHDTVIPRIATQWQCNARIQLRAGYAFHFSPAPTETKDHALLDNHRHITSLGAGFTNPWDLPLNIHLWMQGHFLMKRQHTKDLSNVDDLEDVSFEKITSAGKILVGGFTLGVEL